MHTRMHVHTLTGCSKLADSPPHRFAVVEDTVVVHAALSHIEVALEEAKTKDNFKCSGQSRVWNCHACVCECAWGEGGGHVRVVFVSLLVTG